MPPKEEKAKKSSKKAVAKSDTPKVKKPPSPYINYCSEHRDKLKAANPEATFGMLGKLLGEGWRKLTDVQKKAYAK